MPVDQDAARRDGVTVEVAAEKAASLWKNGLESYGLGKPDLEALRDSASFAVFTPGSDAGIPVSILASCGKRSPARSQRFSVWSG